MPRLTALAIALSLVALPYAAMAQEQGCERDPPTCAAGTVWDAQTKTCVQVSS